jgi:hypothetical protein
MHLYPGEDMNKWNLTPKRLDYVISELEKQMSVTSIALELGIDQDTLHYKLKEAGINHRQVKRKGLEKLRKNCLAWIHEVDDPKDRATVAMKYLDKYLPADEVETTKVEIDVSSAVEQVMNDLQA